MRVGWGLVGGVGWFGGGEREEEGVGWGVGCEGVKDGVVAGGVLSSNPLEACLYPMPRRYHPPKVSEMSYSLDMLERSDGERHRGYRI
jgi:hypothetical protein